MRLFDHLVGAQQDCPAVRESESLSRACSLGEVDVCDQLPFTGMAGNVTPAGRVLCQHDASCGNAADVAVARLEFDLAREPDRKHAARRIVPTRLTRTRRNAAEMNPGGRERIREAQRTASRKQSSARHEGRGKAQPLR